MTKSKPKQKSPTKVASSPPAAAAGNGSDDDLLTTVEVAQWLGVSPQWLETRRTHGGGSDFERLSPRVVRYRRGTVRAFRDSRTHARTDEYSKRAAKKRKTEARLNAT